MKLRRFPGLELGMVLQGTGAVALSNSRLASLAVGIGSVTGSRGVALTAVIGWQLVATPPGHPVVVEVTLENEAASVPTFGPCSMRRDGRGSDAEARSPAPPDPPRPAARIRPRLSPGDAPGLIQPAT